MSQNPEVSPARPNQPEKPKFNPDNAKKARDALKRGNLTVALKFLDHINLEDARSPENCAAVAQALQLRAEANLQVATVESVGAASADMRAAISLIDTLSPDVRQIYEAALVCTATEVQRVRNGHLPVETMDEVDQIVGAVPDEHPAKPILTYFSQRTIGICYAFSPTMSAMSMDRARAAAEEAGVPRDNLLHLSNLSSAKVATLNAPAPYPLSTLYELP
ncbi:MAG TPA: hypothetical protein VLA77_04635 [Candidatus Saccharimonadales bacterium]|nr:hypothetical protein [Candidatus Saccharimonadales bacterium]